MTEDEVTEKVIGAAIEVHKVLGPGLLESAYRQCLCRDLALRGMNFVTEQDLPVEYKGTKLGCGYRLDILVESIVLLELKCVDEIHPIFKAQLLTYMKLGGWKVGLILNFHEAVMKDGIRRMVLGLKGGREEMICSVLFHSGSVLCALCVSAVQLTVVSKRSAGCS
jgi:GxxExxY protein